MTALSLQNMRSNFKALLTWTLGDDLFADLMIGTKPQEVEQQALERLLTVIAEN